MDKKSASRLRRAAAWWCALGLAVTALCGCADTVGLAHGDPGHAPQQAAPPPLFGATTSTPAAPGVTPQAAPVPAGAAAPAVAPPEASPTPPAGGPRAAGYAAVVVTLNDHMQQLAAGDPRLDAAAVAAAVEQELQAHQLLAPGMGGRPTLAITVEDFSTSLASNAMVLGYTFRNAVLLGAVAVKGGPVPNPAFDVHARARLTTRQAGANAGSLGPLYARFAQLVVADLRGVDAPEEPVPR